MHLVDVQVKVGRRTTRGLRDWAAITSAAVFLSGCPPRVELVLFNETRQRLVVRTPDGNSCVLDIGRSCRTPYFERIGLQSEASLRHYTFPPRLLYEVSPQFMERGYWSGRVLKMQVGPGEAIYILPASADRPAETPYPHQRSGFPVYPTPPGGSRVTDPLGLK